MPDVLTKGEVVISVVGLKQIGEQLEAFQKKTKGITETVEKIGAKASYAFFGIAGAVTAAVAVADPIRFEEFKVALEVLGIHVGRIFIPILKDLTAVVNSVAEWFANLSDAQRDSIVWWTELALVIAGVIAVSAAVWSMFSGLVGVLSSVITVCTVLIPILYSVTTAIYAIGEAILAAFLENPITGPIVAVGLLVVALGYLLSKIQVVRDFFSALWDGVVEGIKGVVKWLYIAAQVAANHKKDFILNPTETLGKLGAEYDAAEEKAEKRRQSKNGGDYAPKMLAKPELTGITDLWRKVQTAQPNDPMLRAQLERNKIAQTSDERLAQIAENTGKPNFALVG